MYTIFHTFACSIIFIGLFGIEMPAYSMEQEQEKQPLESFHLFAQLPRELQREIVIRYCVENPTNLFTLMRVNKQMGGHILSISNEAGRALAKKGPDHWKPDCSTIKGFKLHWAIKLGITYWITQWIKDNPHKLEHRYPFKYDVPAWQTDNDKIDPEQLWSPEKDKKNYDSFTELYLWCTEKDEDGNNCKKLYAIQYVTPQEIAMNIRQRDHLYLLFAKAKIQ